MKPVDLQLSNLKLGANFVRVGIPLPKGAVTDCSTLDVVDGNQTHNTAELHSRLVPTARWSDGSVKWCLAKISTLSNTTSSVELTLQNIESSTPRRQLVTAEETPDSIEISSAKTNFVFNKSNPFPCVTHEGNIVWQPDTCRPQLMLGDGNFCELTIDNTMIRESDDLSCKVQISGTYKINDKQTLNAKFIFEVLPDASLTLECELHNPHRAMHAGGIWDLGDSGSISFKDFSFSIPRPDETEEKSFSAQLLAEPDNNWISTSQATVLFQASSGGKHWDNAVHVNAHREVCNRFSGYQITTDNQLVQSGARANPKLAIATAKSAYSVTPQDFWQNFPKSIDVSPDEIAIRLFPYHHGDTHELQGGERKRHHIAFRFTQSIDDAKEIDNITPACAKVSTKAYIEANVFRHLEDTHSCEKYERLLQPSKGDDTGFYVKRENLDEYGWRNFGDVHADHEAANHTEDRPYVSHYNNQYDSVFGFIRQYILTGDHYWQPLFTDLARHIMDIDIYRTTEDRAEYNHGMFWHTDHYVEAHTATHRTYSATQVDSEGHPQNGGGPSSGHCYSTGLAYYYFMTGDEEAKDTVIGLGSWIIKYHDGDGTLIETAKRTLQHDAPNFIQTCKGAKNFKYRYLMDRENGNTLRTLMDCYDLTTDEFYLNKIESIIKQSAGPNDDISARGFEDVEHTWYYVIFLQELIRYLDLKRAIDQFDDNFYYARATLLHYASWMIDNEQPYLHNADKLEYPNATWIAQEPRKVTIFYAAYKYALTDRARFLDRARFFRDHLTEELSTSDTLHYSRIQILLLQNHGASALINSESAPYPGINEVQVPDQGACFYTPASYLKNIVGTWISCLARFRISNELHWIRSRSS